MRPEAATLDDRVRIPTKGGAIPKTHPNPCEPALGTERLVLSISPAREEVLETRGARSTSLDVFGVADTARLAGLTHHDLDGTLVGVFRSNPTADAEPAVSLSSPRTEEPKQ